RPARGRHRGGGLTGGHRWTPDGRVRRPLPRSARTSGRAVGHRGPRRGPRLERRLPVDPLPRRGAVRAGGGDRGRPVGPHFPEGLGSSGEPGRGGAAMTTTPARRWIRGSLAPAVLVRTVLTPTLVTALVTALAGCSGSSPTAPATSAPAVPRHHFARVVELEGAMKAQMLHDKTATTSTTATITVPGEAPTTLPGQGAPEAVGAVSFGADTREVHAFYPVVFDKEAPALVEATVLATDTGYLKPPAGMGFSLPAGKPWAGPFQLAENTKGSRDQQMAVLATVVTKAADPTY